VIYIDQRTIFSVGLVGVRNTIVFTLFHARTEPLTSSDPLASLVAGIQNETQKGASVAWTYRVTPVSNFILDFTGSRDQSVGIAEENTRQGALRATWSTRLSPVTSAYVGARYQRFHSDLSSDYTEKAGFVGLAHIFR
jgi:uncharacterized protein (PEP-CTERM system associated)